MSLPTIHSNQEIDLSKELTIDQFLRRQAAQTPNAIAIVAPGSKSLTYRGLMDQVDYIIRFLRQSGVTHEDRVAIVLPNGPEMAVAFIGIASSAISAPLNPGYREGEFDLYLSELNTRALIVQSGSHSAAVNIARKKNIPVIHLSPVVDAAAGVFQLNGTQVNPTSPTRPAQGSDVALILHTSGTTSRAKMVPLTHCNLIASARNISFSLSLAADDRCLNVMPLFHIHGLVGALFSSLVAGSSIVCTPGFDSDQFFPWLETFHPTWYTAVPTIHQAVLASSRAKPHYASGCSLKFIRSSSSALSPQLMNELEKCFHIPVIEAYGMTEAAHQVCTNPLPPGERKAGSVGMAAGTEVAIIDERETFLSPGDRGEIVLRGSNITRGYDGGAAANENAFSRGCFRTGDQGYIDADGYLFITGRLKEIINRGAEKIAPREIDEALLQHPDVAEAVAFAVPHPSLGEDITAAVVARDNNALTESTIREFLFQRLADFKVPSKIWIVEEIPKGATGKMQRAEIAASFRNYVPPERVASTSRLEEIVTDIYAEVLGAEKVGREDNFFALGGDSLRATQVISRILLRLGVTLSIATIFRKATVSELIEEIDRTLRANRVAGQ